MFRPLPSLFLMLFITSAAAGCSRGGELQADVAAHCADLQSQVERMATSYRNGINHFPLLGGELDGDLLNRVYAEASWCAKVRSADRTELLKLTQELSIIAGDVSLQAPLAAKGKGMADAWAAPEESATRAEVSTKLDRIVVILKEINQRPLKQ